VKSSLIFMMNSSLSPLVMLGRESDSANNLSQAKSDSPSPTHFHRFSTCIFMTTMKIGEGVSVFARDKWSTIRFIGWVSSSPQAAPFGLPLLTMDFFCRIDIHTYIHKDSLMVNNSAASKLNCMLHVEKCIIIYKIFN